MLTAAIDVGSNTIRVLIGEVVNNKLFCIYSGRAITRLAERIRETCVLGESNMAESISVLKAFSHEVEKFKAVKVKAVGTSAVRDAKNGNEFIARAFNETGIRIEPISGIREAELTLKGISIGLSDDVKARPVLAIDIGGGSTEWILTVRPEQQGFFLCDSVPLGVVNLHEKFIKSDPPAHNEIKSINNEVDLLLRPLQTELSGFRENALCIIGTGGTITTLAAMDLGLAEYDHAKVHMHDIPLARLSELMERLITLTLNDRRLLKGLEPGRADLIIPGILLTIRLVELARSNNIIVSDYGLLEGLIKEIMDEEGL